MKKRKTTTITKTLLGLGVVALAFSSCKKDDDLGAKFKPGSIMKEVIEESRQDLKVEQEKLAKREYNK